MRRLAAHGHPARFGAAQCVHRRKIFELFPGRSWDYWDCHWKLWICLWNVSLLFVCSRWGEVPAICWIWFWLRGWGSPVIRSCPFRGKNVWNILYTRNCSGVMNRLFNQAVGALACARSPDFWAAIRARSRTSCLAVLRGENRPCAAQLVWSTPIWIDETRRTKSESRSSRGPMTTTSNGVI